MWQWGCPIALLPGAWGCSGASQGLLLLGPGAGEGHGRRGEPRRGCIPSASPCSSLGFTPCSRREGGRSRDAPGCPSCGYRAGRRCFPMEGFKAEHPYEQGPWGLRQGLVHDHRGSALPLVCPRRDAGSRPSSRGGSTLIPAPDLLGVKAALGLTQPPPCLSFPTWMRAGIATCSHGTASGMEGRKLWWPHDGDGDLLQPFPTHGHKWAWERCL